MRGTVVTVDLNSFIRESIPAYNISLSVKQVNLYETL